VQAALRTIIKKNYAGIELALESLWNHVVVGKTCFIRLCFLSVL